MSARLGTHWKLSSGYAYKLDSAYTWRAAPDDDWETVVVDALHGTKLGTRTIDGAQCMVLDTKEGIYAQMRSHVRAV
jgi:hypothetical protein